MPKLDSSITTSWAKNLIWNGCSNGIDLSCVKTIFVRHSMKTSITYLFFILLVSMSGCKTRHLGFIKLTKEHDVTLTSLASPHINFVLENKDTIIFDRQDVINLIDDRLDKEIKRVGYLSSKHLADLRESLRSVNADTIVFQNLSAVGLMTISDMLDEWIARELLLDGKATVALKDKRKSIQKLKYVYVRDILGGEQGSFYTIDDELVYRAIISLGE